MKKIFTLIVLVTLTATAFAQFDRGNQKGNDDQRDYGYKSNGNQHGNSHWNNGKSYNDRQRDFQIAQINREYDRKIQAVENRMFMNRFRKQKMIRALEEQRMSQIRIVYAKFNDPHNRFGDRYSKGY